MSGATQSIENLDAVLSGESNDEPKGEETSDANTEAAVEESKEIETQEAIEPEQENSEQESSEAEEKAEDDSEPPSEENENKHVPMSAFLGVKDELKQANAKLKEYEAQQAPEDDPNEPDFYDDPEGWKDYQRVKLKQEEMQTRINDSRERLLESKEHHDYLEKEKIFMVMKSYDPSLVEQMQAHPDPAQFAYEKASEYVAQTRTKIEADIRKEYEAKYSDNKAVEPEVSKSKSATEVPKLTETASAKSGLTEVVDQSLDDLFQR